MLRLNADLLFDIGKQLVQDGNSDAVIRFALSGKESFIAMRKVFASVTNLKLGFWIVAIGWNKNLCCKFYLENDEPPMKSLFYQIGNSVKELHIHYGTVTAYQPILDKIISKKQLITFSYYWDDCNEYNDSFLDRFLPVFSSTLKNLEVSVDYIPENFRDTFNLDSLNFIDCPGDGFDEYLFCCKTESLAVSWGSVYDLVTANLPSSRISPYLSSIKQLIVRGCKYSSLGIYVLNGIMKYFNSLDNFEYNYEFYSIEEDCKHFFRGIIRNFIDFVNNAAKAPPKAKYSFELFKTRFDLDYCKTICKGFEFDESITDFWCFRKTLQSAGTQTTIFEVHFKTIF